MTATIRPLRSGGAILTFRGVDEPHPNWWSARDEAMALGASEVVIERFPSFTPGSTPNFAPAPTAAPAA